MLKFNARKFLLQFIFIILACKSFAIEKDESTYYFSGGIGFKFGSLGGNLSSINRGPYLSLGSDIHLLYIDEASLSIDFLSRVGYIGAGGKMKLGDTDFNASLQTFDLGAGIGVQLDFGLLKPYIYGGPTLYFNVMGADNGVSYSNELVSVNFFEFGAGLIIDIRRTFFFGLDFHMGGNEFKYNFNSGSNSLDSKMSVYEPSLSIMAGVKL